jgi:uncharacterized repeat protein (TIGR02543 family)
MKKTILTAFMSLLLLFSVFLFQVSNQQVFATSSIQMNEHIGVIMNPESDSFKGYTSNDTGVVTDIYKVSSASSYSFDVDISWTGGTLTGTHYLVLFDSNMFVLGKPEIALSDLTSPYQDSSYDIDVSSYDYSDIAYIGYHFRIGSGGVISSADIVLNSAYDGESIPFNKFLTISSGVNTNKYYESNGTVTSWDGALLRTYNTSNVNQFDINFYYGIDYTFALYYKMEVTSTTTPARTADVFISFFDVNNNHLGRITLYSGMTISNVYNDSINGWFKYDIDISGESWKDDVAKIGFSSKPDIESLNQRPRIKEEYYLYGDFNEQHTINYDSNGGSSVSSEIVDDNNYATEPSDPTRTGYTFDGWFTDEDVWTDEWSFTTDTVTEDITLYAKWTINSYTVTFDSNDGTAVDSQTIDHGGLVTEPSDPTRSGYVFNGWWGYDEEEFEWNFATETVTENVTLDADWLRLYDVIFNEAGGSTVSDITDVVQGDTITAPTAPTKDGYTFSHWEWNDGYDDYTWSFASDTVGDDKVTSSNDIHLTAVWTADQYTITFDSNSGSAVAAITDDYGSDVTAPEEPTKNGHTFEGWYSDVELATEYEFTTIPGEDITVYAKWTVNTYTITFDSNEGSSISPAVYDYGEETVAPDDPTLDTYTFAGWYSDEELTTPYVFTTMPAEDITIYAKWVLYEELPPTPSTIDYGALFLDYWYILPIVAIGIALVATMFQKPKRRRYRRRY